MNLQYLYPPWNHHAKRPWKLTIKRWISFLGAANFQGLCLLVWGGCNSMIHSIQVTPRWNYRNIQVFFTIKDYRGDVLPPWALFLGERKVRLTRIYHRRIHPWSLTKIQISHIWQVIPFTMGIHIEFQGCVQIHKRLLQAWISVRITRFTWSSSGFPD